MATIWQWDNKHSRQRLIKKKDQNNCSWTFAVHFAIDCELTSKKVISACRNVNQIKIYPTHPTKYKKNRWNEKYSIFLPVVCIGTRPELCDHSAVDCLAINDARPLVGTVLTNELDIFPSNWRPPSMLICNYFASYAIIRNCPHDLTFSINQVPVVFAKRIHLK